MSIKSKYTKQSLKKIEDITGLKLTLSHLILAIRQSEAMTQTEFAALLNVSKQQLCDIEHGRKSLSPRLAADYAGKLGYSKEQFVRLCLQEMVDRVKLNMTIEARAGTKEERDFGCTYHACA